jgi:hypothetical protein
MRDTAFNQLLQGIVSANYNFTWADILFTKPIIFIILLFKIESPLFHHLTAILLSKLTNKQMNTRKSTNNYVEQPFRSDHNL